MVSNIKIGYVYITRYGNILITGFRLNETNGSTIVDYKLYADREKKEVRSVAYHQLLLDIIK